MSYSGSPQGADPTPLLTEQRNPNQDRPATGSPSRGQHAWVHRGPPPFFLVRSIPQAPGGFRRDFRGGAAPADPPQRRATGPAAGDLPGRGERLLGPGRPAACPAAEQFLRPGPLRPVGLADQPGAGAGEQSVGRSASAHRPRRLAALRTCTALCVAADRAVAAGPPGPQPGLQRRTALDPGPGCRAVPRAPLDGVRAVVASAGGVQHQPVRFPPGGAGHAAAGGSGDRWSAPVDRGLGRIDPADPRLP